MHYTGQTTSGDLEFQTNGGVKFIFSDNGTLDGAPYPAVNTTDFLIGYTLSELNPIASYKFKETDLGAAGNSTLVLQLTPGSAVKVEAYTTENNYIQPWRLYVWRAYDFQDAGIHIIPIAEMHQQCSAMVYKARRFARNHENSI